VGGRRLIRKEARAETGKEEEAGRNRVTVTGLGASGISPGI